MKVFRMTPVASLIRHPLTLTASSLEFTDDQLKAAARMLRIDDTIERLRVQATTIEAQHG